MAQPLIAELAKCGPSRVLAGLGLETSRLGSRLKPKLSQAGRNTNLGGFFTYMSSFSLNSPLRYAPLKSKESMSQSCCAANARMDQDNVSLAMGKYVSK